MKQKINMQTVFGFFLLVCAVIASWGAEKTAYISAQAQFPKIEGRQVKIMPLGNSITSAVNGEASYRYYLWKLLEENGYALRCDFVGTMYGVDDYPGATPAYADFDQDHEGHRGYPTAQILNQIDEYMEANIPDIVLFHLGTNDVAYGQNLDTTKALMERVVSRIREANPRVVVMMAKILPLLSFPEDSINGIKLNEKIALLASELDLPQSPVCLVDMFSGISRLHLDIQGIHPDFRGEQIMAKRWYRCLAPVLNAMIGKPTEISPPSGVFAKHQKWQLFNVVRFPRDSTYITDSKLFIDGEEQKVKAVWRILPDNAGVSFWVNQDIHGWDFSAGNHEIAIKHILRSGACLTDTATWTIIR